MNLDLIQNLMASNSAQNVEDIVLAVRELALKYSWTPEETMEVADMVVTQSHAAAQRVLDTAQVVLADLFGVRNG